MDRKRWLVLIAAAALALAVFVGGALYLLSFPTGNTVVVRYKTGGATVPMTIENVREVRRYDVHGALYQVVVFIDGALVPEVFTPWEIVGYRLPLFSEIPFRSYTDEVYHTYDPYLQGWKNEQRKAFIHKTYAASLGREPTEEEFNLALAIMIQKVQLTQWETRLAHTPEAVMYRINALRETPLTSAQQKRVVRLLERGKSPDEIVEVFTG